MRRTLNIKAPKYLVLAACVALLTGSSGCSLDGFGPFAPIVKLGYNAIATMINGAFFGGSTSTGIAL